MNFIEDHDGIVGDFIVEKLVTVLDQFRGGDEHVYKKKGRIE